MPGRSFLFEINKTKYFMKKHLHTFEEFVGDEETNKIKKLAIDQEKKAGDEIYLDPDDNDPDDGNDGDDDDEDNGN